MASVLIVTPPESTVDYVLCIIGLRAKMAPDNMPTLLMGVVGC